MAEKPTYEDLEKRVRELERLKSEQKRVEEKLYEEIIFNQTLLQAAPVFFVAINAQGKTIMVNEMMLHSLGYKLEEVVGKDYMTTFVPKKNRKELSGIFDNLIRLNKPTLNENYILTKEGREILIEWHGRSIFNKKGELAYFFGLGIDITKRRKAENELKESERRFRELAEMLPETIFEIDLQGKLTFINQNAFNLFGYTQEEFEKGINILGLIHENDRKRALTNINKILKGENPGITEYEISGKDGNFFPCLFHSSAITQNNIPVGLRGFLIDITEKKHTQEILIQNEKMMSIGGLAAGMAHEINNPIAGMVQNAQVAINRLSKDLPANDEAAAAAGTTMTAIKTYMEKRGILQLLGYINTSGAQAAKIVQNMLSFARGKDLEKKPHDMPELIEKTFELMRNDFNIEKNYDFKDIQIVRTYDPGLPGVPCEETKIQQVVMNIVKNSIDAAIEAQKKLKGLVLYFRLINENKMICLEIEDNGPGIDHETRRRIFEPFFTTKSVDKGTGLGLSISYFIIVDNHKGEMEVESSPGKGTKFIIRLPVQPD